MVLLRKLSIEEKKAERDSRELAERALEAIIALKGLDPSCLEIAQVSDITDYFIIASGTSDRHVRGLADRVQQCLAEVLEEPFSVAGLETAEWVLIDYGSIVVHLFLEPVRQFYNLDQLWQNAPRISLKPELEKEAQRLRTGLYAHL